MNSQHSSLWLCRPSRQSPIRLRTSAQGGRGPACGGGSVVVQPGSGPKPVDPEPFREWQALPASKRQLIMGMALTELTSFIDDAEARQLVKQAGQTLTAKAAARLTTTKKMDTKIEKKIDKKGARAE